MAKVAEEADDERKTPSPPRYLVVHAELATAGLVEQTGRQELVEGTLLDGGGSVHRSYLVTLCGALVAPST